MMKQLLLITTLLACYYSHAQDIVGKITNRTYATNTGTALTKFGWNDTSFMVTIPNYEMYYFSDVSANIKVHSNGRITFTSKSVKNNKGTINIWGADLCQHKTLPSSMRIYMAKNPGSSEPDLLTIVWENAGFVADTSGTAYINFSVTFDSKASNGYKTYIDVGSYANINNAWFSGGAPGIKLTNPDAVNNYQFSNIDTTFTKNSTSLILMSGLPAVNTRLSIYNPIQVIDNRNYVLKTDIDYPVLWVNNTGKRVNVQYSSDDGQSWNTIASGLDSSYVYSYEYWNVPNQFYGRFLFRVSTTDGSYSGTSFNYTSLYHYGPSQALSMPATTGSNLYPAGKKIAVRWNSTNVPLVNIALYDPVAEANVYHFGIFKSNNGANTDSITLPENLNTDKLFIDIWGTFSAIDFQSPFPFARSTNPIAITTKPSHVVLNTPAAITEYAYGTIVPVTYSTINVRKVKLMYMNEETGSRHIIVDSMLPSGSYNWKIPADSMVIARLRISSVDDTTVFSYSSLFSVSPPRLSLNTPVGGQKYTGGNKVNIAWTQFGVRKIKIEYTTDGVTWKTVVDSVAATPSPYQWTVPNDSTLLGKIRITDIDYPATSALSGTFEIVYKATTGTDEQNLLHYIKFGPNPTTDMIRISATGPVHLEMITLFDLLGNKLFSNSADIYTQSIDVSALQSGLYFIEIKTDAGYIRKQLVKH